MSKITLDSWIASWVRLIANAMVAQGRYRHHSMRNTGVGDDRRDDKLTAYAGWPKHLRAYCRRYRG